MIPPEELVKIRLISKILEEMTIEELEHLQKCLPIIIEYRKKIPKD